MYCVRTKLCGGRQLSKGVGVPHYSTDIDMLDQLFFDLVIPGAHKLLWTKEACNSIRYQY